jgi:chaperonin GroES
MAFTATEDRVILKLTHEDKVTDSGIVIPQEVLPVPDKGEVVAAGPGRHSEFGILMPMSVQIGDIVVFDKAMAYGIEIDKEKYVVIPESGIRGILKEE